MNNTVFTTYLIANAALVLSYALTFTLLKIPFINRQLTQIQQLTFARICLIATVVMFLLMPSIAALLPVQNANYELQPILHHASSSFLKHHQVVATQLSVVQTMPWQLPMGSLLILTWLAGFVIFNRHYFKVMLNLSRLRKNAFCRHSLHGIHILFSNTIDAPFCWSIFNKHFIAIPAALLEKPDDMRLAMRHELQHIRQGDTQWLHVMMLLKGLCFWNPLVKTWMTRLNELQEFACDEALILRKNTSPSQYAQCLLDAARHCIQVSPLTQGVLAMNGLSKSILYRRVNMLFNYKNHKRKLTLIAAYALGFCAITSAAYALNSSSSLMPVTAGEIGAVIKEYNLTTELNITATPAVLAEVNRIRGDQQAKSAMLAGLKRMKTYKPVIQAQLQKNAMPTDLLALPLVESGYRPLDASKNRMAAAGIWQIIPSTAKNLNLTVTKKNDQRLNTQLSTQAAVAYLSALHDEFHDWKLSVLAYEIGEQQLEKLMTETGSRDPWVIVNASSLPNEYKQEFKSYLANFDASVIFMHAPALLTQ